MCRVCANLSGAYQAGIQHFTKWKSGVFFKEHVKYMRPHYPDASDDELFAKVKDDFVAARKIRDEKKQDLGDTPKNRKKTLKNDTGSEGAASLEDNVEVETELQLTAPDHNDESDEDEELPLVQKRAPCRDSSNREAKRAKFMVKIAHLDEEASKLKEQATVVKNTWLKWEMERLSDK